MPNPELLAWARNKCVEVARTCRLKALDGTTLFTPDGVGNYGALWTRDYAYLLEHGGEFLGRDESRAAIEVLLAGQRHDGAVPDRVNQRLVPLFHPGGIEGPLGHGPALDNPLFLVAAVYHYHRRHRDAELVKAALPVLRRGLAWMPLNRGLVFNDPQERSSTYGFQDTVAKGGHDLFCSLLWVCACRQMASLDPEQASRYQAAIAAAEDGLRLLWDEGQGIYLAANEVCRQIDVWGNAFLVAEGIGSAERRDRVARWLAAHYADYTFAGQVRHLPGDQVWQSLFGNVPAGTYQNGGYWGTASGWLIKALNGVAPELARRTMAELMAYYQQNGVVEWAAPDGRKGPDLYVASIMNVWTLAQQMV